MNDMDKYLPGGPSNALIKRVRSALSRYGIRPERELWRMAWEWAYKVDHSYLFTSRRHWPAASEIASQYVFVLLTKMRADLSLRLPFRASTELPQSVKALVAEAAQWKSNGQQLKSERLALPLFDEKGGA